MSAEVIRRDDLERWIDNAKAEVEEVALANPESEPLGYSVHGAITMLNKLRGELLTLTVWPEARTRVRKTDPDTSKDAASRIKDGHISELQNKILHVFGQRAERGLTDTDLILAAEARMWGVADSSLRTRRRELADAGWLVDSGERRQTESNRPSIVWKLSATRTF